MGKEDRYEMKQYLDLLEKVLTRGHPKSDRTGTGTLSLFGEQMRFNLQEGFPLLTTKKVHLKSVIHELLWMLKGSTNIKYLNDNGVTIWDEWADEYGRLGPIYGDQWRHWKSWDNEGQCETIDQITEVIQQIHKTPDSRRLLVSAWNVADLPEMALAPCHCLFQFYVVDMRLSERLQYEAKFFGRGDWTNEGYAKRCWTGRTSVDKYHKYLDELGVPRKSLSCKLTQRSGDLLLGVPFNSASYALLTMMVAQVCDLAVGELVHSFGDVHLYSNHVEQAKLQLTREPRELPRMILNPEVKDIFQFKYEDFTLTGYDPHPAIKAEVAV